MMKYYFCHLPVTLISNTVKPTSFASNLQSFTFGIINKPHEILIAYQLQTDLFSNVNNIQLLTHLKLIITSK